MEPEGSLPCSQKPTIGPYPEPAESSSPIIIYLRLNYFKLNLFFIVC
jgi:hypothetical protein